MSDFTKQFLLEDPRRINAVNGRQILLSAFGKHPGWADYFDVSDFDGGTRTTYWAKTVLHLEGFAKRSDTQPTEKQTAGVALPHGFVFLWQRDEQFLVGRFWPSRDASGRTYPMFVFFQFFGLPLDWVLSQALPRLETIQQDCTSVQSAVQVRSILERDLLAMRRDAGADLPASQPLIEDRDKFLAHPDLGTEQRGLLNVLHQVRSEMGTFLRRQAGSKVDWSDASARRVRVPVCGATPGETLLLWSQFFGQHLLADVPRLFTLPVGQTWLDVTVGKPRRQDVFLLLHSLQETPPASSIPYELDDYIKTKGQEILMAFRTGAELPKSGTTFLSKREPKTAIVESAKKLEPEPEKPVRSRKPWLLIGVAVAAIVVALVTFSRVGKTTSDRTEAQNVKTETRTGQDTQAKLEQDFKTALAGAREARVRKDFAKAIALADTALRIEPNNSEAQELRADAQAKLNQATFAREQERNYELASNAAGAAIRQSNYSEAVAQAEKALAIKANDPAALKLKADAQRQLKVADVARDQQRRYLLASSAAELAYRQGDYSNAVFQADQALGIRTNDPTALKLKADAQAKLNQAMLARDQDQSYSAATNAAVVAIREGKYGDAMAQLDKALAINPNDPAALKLRADANRGSQEDVDFVTAGKTFKAGNYAEALRICEAHKATVRFDALALEIQNEQRRLNEAEQALDAGQYNAILKPSPPWPVKPPFEHVQQQADKESAVLREATEKLQRGEYGFIEAMSRERYSTKPPFVAVLDEARREANALTSLLALRSENKPSEVLHYLGGLSQTVRNKAPFAEVASWASDKRLVARSGTRTNSVGMILVWVPNLTGTKDGGWVGKYEVTQGQYQKIMGSNPSSFSGTAVKFKGYDWGTLPVENVTLQNAREFCAKLTRSDESGGILPSGFSYRLPTTNQWDYYQGGAVVDSSVTSFERSRTSPSPVGQSPANRFGLYDVVGNVWEWCCEPKADLGMLKGLAFNSTKSSFARYPQPIERIVFSSTNALPYVGFRCILTADAGLP